MEKFTVINGSMANFRVLLSSRSGEFLSTLEQTLIDSGINLACMTRCITNGHMDPLYDLETMPDLLILHLSEHWEAELSQLASHSAVQRPPVFVIGDTSNSEMMRQAMKAGARDFFSLPLNSEELISSLQQIQNELKVMTSSENGTLTAVINAKGGSGASLLACNIAYLMQTNSGQSTVLTDMDMQFGSLAEYFNMKPENGISEALKVTDELDQLALNAYMLKHNSGLKILGATTQSLRLPNQIPERQITQLLSLILKSCQQLVVDLPRLFDMTTISTLQRANRIIVVVQQDLLTIKDAIHMLQVFRNELAILDEQIVVVVNRYEKNAPITLTDIRESLKINQLVTIPNDYKVVMESLNKGTPIAQVSKRSAINKAINEFQDHLIKQDNFLPEQGVLSNLFSRLTGG